MKKFLCAFIAVLVASVEAAVVLPAIFSDRAVLARKAKVPVFGKAIPGEKVVVTFNGQTRETVAGKNGKWRVDLNLADSPEGPFELKVNNIVIKDVIVGEVWLCSGQSNMAYGMGGSAGYKEERAKPVRSRLRSFKVKQSSSKVPLDDVPGRWYYASKSGLITFPESDISSEKSSFMNSTVRLV